MPNSPQSVKITEYFDYVNQGELRTLASSMMKVIIPSNQKIGGGEPPLVWSKNYPLKDLPHTLDIYRRILNLENPPTDICLQDIVYWSNIQLHGNGLAKGLPASNKILTWKGMKWGHFLRNYVPDQTTSPPARACADWLQACQTWPTATLHHQPSQ